MKLPNRLDNIQFYSIWVYITKYSDCVLSVLVGLHVIKLKPKIPHFQNSPQNLIEKRAETLSLTFLALCNFFNKKCRFTLISWASHLIELMRSYKSFLPHMNKMPILTHENQKISLIGWYE